MIALLKLVPAWVWVALAVAVSFGILDIQLQRAKSELAEVTGERDTATAKANSLSNTLALQRQVTDDVNRAADNAQTQNQSIQAAVVVADGRARSLQQQITDLLSSRRACTAEVASGSKARADLTVLLADLRRSADETAGSLAKALDESRLAGFTCESVYEAARSNRAALMK